VGRTQKSKVIEIIAYCPAVVNRHRVNAAIRATQLRSGHSPIGQLRPLCHRFLNGKL